MLSALDQGLIQVYTGNGKGKSTAAFGQALRAAGSGLKVRIVQFMKNDTESPEIRLLKKIVPEIQVSSFGSKGFITHGKGTEQDQLLAGEAYCLAVSIVEDEDTDVLVLDEINNAVYFGLIDQELVVKLLQVKPSKMEMILTGRNAPRQFIEMADLVTSMEEIKHPFRSGVMARPGIEY
jgi:cob(I)alamin adenosyltransferase